VAGNEGEIAGNVAASGGYPRQLGSVAVQVVALRRLTGERNGEQEIVLSARRFESIVAVRGCRGCGQRIVLQ